MTKLPKLCLIVTSHYGGNAAEKKKRASESENKSLSQLKLTQWRAAYQTSVLFRFWQTEMCLQHRESKTIRCWKSFSLKFDNPVFFCWKSIKEQFNTGYLQVLLNTNMKRESDVGTPVCRQVSNRWIRKLRSFKLTTLKMYILNSPVFSALGLRCFCVSG